MRQHTEANFRESRVVSDIPNDLIEAIDSGRCILFLGAGASIDSEFPTWAGILQTLFSEVINRNPDERHKENEYHELLNVGAYMAIADYCMGFLGRVDFASIMEANFHRSAQSTWHNSLSKIPFNGAVTTNFDRLLEQYWPNPILLLPNDQARLRGGIPAWKRAKQANGFPILKLHGSCENPNSIVMTTEDYRNLIFCSQPLRDLMADLLAEYTFLFIGFSFRDPHVENLFQGLFSIRDGLGTHYAIAPDAGEIWKQYLWNNYSVRTISYPVLPEEDHSRGLEIINQLGPYRLNESDLDALEKLTREGVDITMNEWLKKYYVNGEPVPRVAFSLETGEIEIAWVSSYMFFKLCKTQRGKKLEYGFLTFVSGREACINIIPASKGSPLSVESMEKIRRSIALSRPDLRVCCILTMQ